MTRTADAIVVVGGIIGASVLYQLGALGVRRALLCDTAQPGAGASGASGAFVQLHFCRNEPETALTLASLPYFARWAELVGAGDPGFVQAGYLRLEPPERAAILHKRVALLQTFGGGTSVISIEEVARLAPYLHTDPRSPGAERFWRSLPTTLIHDDRDGPSASLHFEMALPTPATPMKAEGEQGDDEATR